MKTPDQEVLYYRVKLDGFKFFLERSIDHWSEDLEKYKSSLSQSDMSEPFNGRRDLYASLDSEFPQYQSRANLMILVAFFEDFLNQLALSIQDYKRLSTEFSSYNEGRGIDKFKNYFRKIASLRFPSELVAWNKIKNAQKIRNIIAHTDGHIHEIVHKEHLDIIKHSKGLEFDEYARIHLNIKNDYVIDTWKYMRRFATALYDSVKGMNKKTN